MVLQDAKWHSYVILESKGLHCLWKKQPGKKNNARHRFASKSIWDGVSLTCFKMSVAIWKNQGTSTTALSFLLAYLQKYASYRQLLLSGSACTEMLPTVAINLVQFFPKHVFKYNMKKLNLSSLNIF